MSLVADFELTSSNLLLGPTLEECPTLEVTLERQFALDPDRPISFCWMAGVQPPVLEEVFERDGTVATSERLETADERTLYALTECGEESVGTYRRWVALGSELLEACVSAGGWECRMRFPGRDALAAYHEYLTVQGVGFDLHRLATGGDSVDGAILTPYQRNALRTAYERGFFDVPRGSTLEEIAAELGISDQALSERLRRGQSRLVERHVL
ncbi:helix-turn-helix domain-containing protein [Natronobiforma cellulositropha]|uniref:helix-turn-helix domain-containing protein n=1 Tax=Natronobiforma cellulositropha TaxID=1679076 RepID=UPI0021D5B43B|nr:helix-turn-helix domain-containing protein [Natronobiforma cellulositropha]